MSVLKTRDKTCSFAHTVFASGLPCRAALHDKPPDPDNILSKRKQRNSSTAADRKKQFIAIQEIMANNPGGVRSRELRKILSDEYGFELDASMLRSRLDVLDKDGVLRFEGERSARTYWLIADGEQTTTPAPESDDTGASEQGELEVTEPEPEPAPEIPRRRRKPRRGGRTTRSTAKPAVAAPAPSRAPEPTAPPIQAPVQEPAAKPVVEAPEPVSAPPEPAPALDVAPAPVAPEPTPPAASKPTAAPSTIAQPIAARPTAHLSDRYAELDALLQELVGQALAEKDFEASRILFEAAQAWGELLAKRAGA